jgi:hypothetical protein
MKFFIYFILVASFQAQRASAQPVDVDSLPKKLKENIRKVILEKKHSEAIRKCYEDLLDKKPQAEGKIVLKWEIDQKGNVPKAEVMSGSEEMSKVSACMVKNLKSWHFSNLGTDKIIEVSYPFVFMTQKE